MLYPLNLAVSLEIVMFTLDTIKMCYNVPGSIFNFNCAENDINEIVFPNQA